MQRRGHLAAYFDAGIRNDGAVPPSKEPGPLAAHLDSLKSFRRGGAAEEKGTGAIVNKASFQNGTQP